MSDTLGITIPNYDTSYGARIILLFRMKRSPCSISRYTNCDTTANNYAFAQYGGASQNAAWATRPQARMDVPKGARNGNPVSRFFRLCSSSLDTAFGGTKPVRIGLVRFVTCNRVLRTRSTGIINKPHGWNQKAGYKRKLRRQALLSTTSYLCDANKFTYQSGFSFANSERKGTRPCFVT